MIASSQRGGAESALATLLAGLDRERYECFVAFHGSGPMADEYRRCGARTAAFDLLLPFRPRQVRELAVWLKQVGAHVVHTHLWTGDVIGGVAGLLAKVPIRIASVWGEYFLGVGQRGPKRLRTRVLALGYRVIYRVFDRVVPVSEAVADGLARRPGIGVDRRHMRVIHPGIDAARLTLAATSPSPLAPVGARPLITAVGNLFSIKGHRWLVEAMPRVVARYPDAALLLIGEGPEREALERRIVELGLAARVSLVGSRGDVPQLLARSHVVVVPSISEGLPLVILEALALGMPVVATQVGGVPEIVEHRKTGLLVPPRDPNAIAEAILTVLSSPDLAGELGANGRRVVAERFGAGRMVGQFERLYCDLARSRGLVG